MKGRNGIFYSNTHTFVEGSDQEENMAGVRNEIRSEIL